MIDLKDKNIKFFIKTFSRSIRWDTCKHFDEFNLAHSSDLKTELFKNSLRTDKDLALEIYETFTNREVENILKESNLYEKVRKYTINQLLKSVK